MWSLCRSGKIKEYRTENDFDDMHVLSLEKTQQLGEVWKCAIAMWIAILSLSGSLSLQYYNINLYNSK